MTPRRPTRAGGGHGFLRALIFHVAMYRSRVPTLSSDIAVAMSDEFVLVTRSSSPSWWEETAAWQSAVPAASDASALLYMFCMAGSGIAGAASAVFTSAARVTHSRFICTY